jgi:glycosyltransferase involved in cell wall biosynthesis
MLAKVNAISPAKMRVLYNAIPVDFSNLLGAGVIGNEIPFETPVIPAKAGIQSGGGAFPTTCEVDSRLRGNDAACEIDSRFRGNDGACEVDSRWRGNDCTWELRCPAIDTSTGLLLSGASGAHSAGSSHVPLLLSVGGVSKAHEYKGVDMVIRSMPRILAAVPSVHYVVVGDGDNRRELERLAEREGVACHVRFVGAIRDAELATLYRTCDLFVMPSRVSECAGLWTGEGFGRVYAEAALAGKPVVGSRGGGAAEAVLDGKTGLLVDPFSLDEIAGAVVGLLSNPEAARSMGRRAREWAIENFTLPVMQRALGALLEPYQVGNERRLLTAASAAAECGPWRQPWDLCARQRTSPGKGRHPGTPKHSAGDRER